MGNETGAEGAPGVRTTQKWETVGVGKGMGANAALWSRRKRLEAVWSALGWTDAGDPMYTMDIYVPIHTHTTITNSVCVHLNNQKFLCRRLPKCMNTMNTCVTIPSLPAYVPQATITWAQHKCRHL